EPAPWHLERPLPARHPYTAGGPVDLSPPTPVCKALVVCRQIFLDEGRQDCALISPVHQVFLPRFPPEADLPVFAPWSNAHGRYAVELQLRDLEGAVLWRDVMHPPFEVADPLAIVPLTLRHRLFRFPAPGKYEVALLANGHEVIADVFLARPEEPTA